MGAFPSIGVYEYFLIYEYIFKSERTSDHLKDIVLPTVSEVIVLIKSYL